MTWTNWEKVKDFDFTDIIYEKKFVEETGGGVARVTINRPERLNAFNQHTEEEWSIALDNASRDPMIGIVVFTGAGDRAFSSGGDVAMESGQDWGLQLYLKHPSQRMFRLCRKPIIAAVKGYAIGGGNHLAYMCDVTIAADNAIFGQNGPRIGSPADGYYVSYLTRVVGAKKAREMWMWARRYNAQQALEMGLVNAVVPLDKLDEEVDKWCEEILTLDPTCIEILKATFDREIDYLEAEHGKLLRLMAPEFLYGPESKEAHDAFFEKRKPNFWQFRTART